MLLNVLFYLVPVGVVATFEGFETDSSDGTADLVIKVFFVLLTFAMNFHVGLLALSVEISIPVLIIGAACYPFTVILCCWRKLAILQKPPKLRDLKSMESSA